MNCKYRKFEKRLQGDVICKQGDDAQRFYVIVTGRTLKATTLKTCRYPNGKWYDSGRGGSGAGYRAKCRTTDTSSAGGDVEGTGLVVIQNNWMVGRRQIKIMTQNDF